MGTPESNVQSGLKLILEELRDLRLENRAALQQAAEDRRTSDEDRRRSDQRFDRIIERMNEDRRRMDEDRRRMDERINAERKRSDRRFSQLLRGVVDVGRKILKTQQEHTKLLVGIHKAVFARGNGRNGNGHSRK